MRGTCLGPGWINAFGSQNLMVRDAVIQHYWRFQRPLVPHSGVVGFHVRRVLSFSVNLAHSSFEYNCSVASIDPKNYERPGLPRDSMLYINSTGFEEIS